MGKMIDIIRFLAEIKVYFQYWYRLENNCCYIFAQIQDNFSGQ